MSVAIGVSAGQTNQGANSVAIGSHVKIAEDTTAPNRLVVLKLRGRQPHTTGDKTVVCAFVNDRTYETRNNVINYYNLTDVEHWYCVLLTEKEVEKRQKELDMLRKIVIDEEITASNSANGKIKIPMFNSELARYSAYKFMYVYIFSKK